MNFVAVAPTHVLNLDTVKEIDFTISGIAGPGGAPAAVSARIFWLDGTVTEIDGEEALALNNTLARLFMAAAAPPARELTAAELARGGGGG